jgi:hypothetical protein
MTQPQTQNRKCIECDGLESEHSYSPPGWESSDGLPTFEGCYHKGIMYHRDDDEGDYPIPICDCTELVVEHMKLGG